MQKEILKDVEVKTTIIFTKNLIFLDFFVSSPSKYDVLLISITIIVSYYYAKSFFTNNTIIMIIHIIMI